MLELIEEIPKILKNSKKLVESLHSNKAQLKMQTNEIVYPNALDGMLFASNVALQSANSNFAPPPPPNF